MPTLEPVRTAILKALTAHLETIEYDSYNTHHYSLANSVFRGRSVFGDEVHEPFLNILEKPRQLLGPVAGESKTIRDDTWDLMIEGFAPDDKKHPLDPATELLAYVEQRMSRLLLQKTNGAGPVYPEEHLLGMKGIVTSVSFIIPIVRPPNVDVSDTAFFYMPLSIGVKTDMASPFIEE